jgi:glutamate/aspartate transport system substrate-binding protein
MAGAAALLVSWAAPVVAQRALAYEVPYTGTLKKIRDTGVIRLGFRENSPPFAFRAPDGRPVGYALDLCEIVVDEVIAELRRDIRTELRPVTPENRFDLVINGEVDLECGSTTNNAERRKVVAFSPTMFITGTKLLVRRGSGIRSLRDLQGRAVALTRGTVQADAIPRIAARQKLAINFVTAADHNESFKLLTDGKVDAFANDDVQLYGMVAQARAAGDFRVVGDFLTYADYALMLRRNDPEFEDVVKRAFERLAGSREIVAIYERWFLKPLPSGVRLNLPMSPHLEEVFKVQGMPTD